MTEEEIINYLKENKTKGIMYSFMHEDVKIWCNNHLQNIYKWNSFNKIWHKADEINHNTAYCLADNYTHDVFESYWQEFIIGEDGYFYFEDKKYYYREDDKFETENHDKFKGFGGWLYVCKDGLEIWTLHPLIELPNSHTLMPLYENNKVNKNVKAVRPIAIRFYRIRE